MLALCFSQTKISVTLAMKQAFWKADVGINLKNMLQIDHKLQNTFWKMRRGKKKEKYNMARKKQNIIEIYNSRTWNNSFNPTWE